MKKIVIGVFFISATLVTIKAQSQFGYFRNIYDAEKDKINLEFIDEIAKKKRIIFLCENSHLDGTTLNLQYEISKYLIEKHGFTKIFVEYSFSQIEKTMDQLDSQKDLFELFYDELSSTVLNTREFRSFLKDIKPYIFGEQTLRFVGIDITSNTKVEQMLSYLKSEIYESKIHIDSIEKIEKTIGEGSFSFLYCHQCPIYEKDYKKLMQYTQVGINFFDSVYKKKGNVALLKKKRGWEILKEGAEGAFNKQFPPIDRTKDRMFYGSLYFRRRDSIMAKNILWNADSLYRNEKIIIWVSAYHAMRDLAEAESIYDCCIYPGIRTAGDLVYRSTLKDSMYTIAFIRGVGESGLANDLVKLPSLKIKKGSLEQYLHRKGIKFGFVDFHEWKEDRPFYMNPTFAKYQKEKWYKMYDGVIYINKMEPLRITGWR